MKNSIKTIIATVALALSVTAVSLPASADVADGFPPAFRDALSPGNYNEAPDWVREAFKPASFEGLSPELREALDPARFDIEALEPVVMEDVPAWARDAFSPDQNDERNRGLRI